MGPPDDRSADCATTAYDREALAEAYDGWRFEAETIPVDDEKYDRMRRRASNDALGGARVLLASGDRTLLVSNLGEPGWDIPGGARESGEAPETTARREVSEEVGLRVALADLAQVFEFGFVPEERDGERVAGLWVHFSGTPRDGTELTVQTSELADARWMATPPESMDPYAAPLIETFFEGE